MYVFGGCGPEGRLNDLWAFSVDKGEWERMPAVPEGKLSVRGGV